MKIFITADDLTGASDSAVQFAKCGLDSKVMLRAENNELKVEADVLVCDCESRDIAKADAYSRVSEITRTVVAKYPEVLLYKKTDSTLRGNVGAELEASLKSSHADFVLFAPAFIKTGRTTLHGVMYLHGEEIAKTELANIPKSPITKSYIPDIINAGSSLKCGVLDEAILKQGKEQCIRVIKRLLIEDRVKIIICDATSEEHLALAASCAFELMDSGYRAVLAGSAGLAAYVAQRFEKTVKNDVNCFNAKRVLVLAGSISETTRSQVKALEHNSDCVLFRSNAQAVVRDPVAAARVDAEQIRKLVEPVVMVSAAYEKSDVTISGNTATALGLTFFDAGERTAIYMANLARLLAPSFDSFVMTGGDTAVHACKALNAITFKIIKEVEAGIPLSQIAEGSEVGKYIVTKAGAFGTQDAFVKAVDLLRS